MAEISAAINQIDVKKQNLNQSFIHLQSQSPSTFNLPLNWADIDTYFTTIHSSLHSKFNLLHTFFPHARPELKTFCQNSDALGLMHFIALASDRSSILSELPDAYGYAPDAAAMVLDAMVAFYTPSWKEVDLFLFRIGCLIMLEGLVRVKPKNVTIELKDKAMEMAMQWNRKRVFGPGNVKALGFVLLVGAYGLIDHFSIDDVCDCFLIFATYSNAIDLCRRIVPADNINYMIQKRIDKDMNVSAVKFSIELNKTDEFPPVGLLEQLKLRSMRVMEEKRANASCFYVWKAVTMEQISTLKSIIECVDAYHLDSEYLKDSVIELVNKLENELNGLLSKQSPRVGVLQRQQLLSKPKKPKLDKVQPTAESAVVMPVLARPELKSFCENSDGSGLMRFISLASRSDQRLILSELPDAYQCTPDAPAMVLDAMVAFYNYSCRDTELLSFRSGCMIMLEGLLHLKPDITIGLKNKAMEMAVQWNQKRVFCPCEQKALGFVLLVGAYGLIDQFSIDDIADCFLIVATDRHTTDLCRRIILPNNINHMIQKLIDEDMIVTAVKFSIELQKTVEFPPVVLLEELKLRSMRVMEKKRRNVKYLDVWNSITMEEIGTLRSIIDCVEENHLEAEYPKDSVIELVNNLENEMENGNHVKRLLGKEPPRETLLRLQLLSESKKPKQNKFKPIDVSAATMHVQSVKLIQESHSQKPDLSPDHVGQCYNSPHVFGPNGFSAQFACPIVKLDGSTRADVVYNFYAPQLQPFSDSNSNGWISD